MTAHPEAFVDEAFMRLHQHPGAYLFAAVLVDADAQAASPLCCAPRSAP